MKITDITRPIAADMPVYSGDPEVVFENVKSIVSGNSCNLTRLSFGSHTSTHMDAPLHFIQDGLPVDEIPLDTLIGSASVMEVPEPVAGGDVFGRTDLEGTERLLLVCRAGGRGVSLLPEAAELIAGCGVKLVGTESLSVEPPGSEGRDTHKILLGAGIVIVEGIDLTDVAPGHYELVCMPLKLAGCDGSPVRAALIER